DRGAADADVRRRVHVPGGDPTHPVLRGEPEPTGGGHPVGHGHVGGPLPGRRGTRRGGVAAASQIPRLNIPNHGTRRHRCLRVPCCRGCRPATHWAVHRGRCVGGTCRGRP